MSDATRIQNLFKKYRADGSVVISRTKSKEFQYTALGKETSIHADSDVITGITLVRDSTKLFLRVKGDDVSEMERVIEKNIAFLDVVSPDPDVYIAEVDDILEADERRFRVDDVDADFLYAQWNTVQDFAFDPHISVESFSYSVEEEEKEFINSHGAHKKYASARAMHSLELYYESESFSDVYARYRFSDTNESVGVVFVKDAHDYLLQRSHPVAPSLSSGVHTVTLENWVVASFLEILADALTWEGLRQKTSFFSLEDLHKSVLDPRLTIRSNPAREHSPFNRLFDGEGVTTEELMLVRDWVLENVFLDVKNAKKLSLLHTGNPRPANIEVIAAPDADYLKNSKFLFTELMAFHTVDGISGKFALEGEGFEIIDGKKGNYIKNVSLSGNIRDLFSNIEAFGGDMYTDANIFTPSITFRNQTVVV